MTICLFSYCKSSWHQLFVLCIRCVLLVVAALRQTDLCFQSHASLSTSHHSTAWTLARCCGTSPLVLSTTLWRGWHSRAWWSRAPPTTLTVLCITWFVARCTPLMSLHIITCARACPPPLNLPRLQQVRIQLHGRFYFYLSAFERRGLHRLYILNCYIYFLLNVPSVVKYRLSS